LGKCTPLVKRLDAGNVPAGMKPHDHAGPVVAATLTKALRFSTAARLFCSRHQPGSDRPFEGGVSRGRLWKPWPATGAPLHVELDGKEVAATRRR
jgi:hypothetical protein